MAVPANFSILDLSGTFTMNKTLSDSTDKMLGLQGVSWLKRRAISFGTVTLSIKHYKDDQGVEHIDISQEVHPGGFTGTTELRILDWEERPKEDHVFGAVLSRSRRIKLDEITDEFLKEGWTEDTIEHDVVQSYVVSDTAKSRTTWIADQVWGVQVIDGERRYVRRVHFTGPKGEDIQTKLIYDYLGPVE